MGRQGYAWVSPDFHCWLQGSVPSFLLIEPLHLADRGPRMPYDQVHSGVAAASFGNVLVGLYGIWQNPDYSEENLDFLCDLGLVVSNDGIHFREPVKGHIFLGQDKSPSTPIEGKSYPTLLYQCNGILNVGDESLIYHGRRGNLYYGHPFDEGQATEDYYSEIALSTLPRDRWGALGLFPDRTEGSVWSAPVMLPAGQPEVLLNAEHADQMRVEIADRNFRLAPGLLGRAKWPGGRCGRSRLSGIRPEKNLRALAGEQVRLRFQMKRKERSGPRLYAVSIVTLLIALRSACLAAEHGVRIDDAALVGFDLDTVS